MFISEGHHQIAEGQFFQHEDTEQNNYYVTHKNQFPFFLELNKSKCFKLIGLVLV